MCNKSSLLDILFSAGEHNPYNINRSTIQANCLQMTWGIGYSERCCGEWRHGRGEDKNVQPVCYLDSQVPIGKYTQIFTITMGKKSGGL